jgi:MFS family permease
VPAGFHAIITAQFLSALADNALLLVAIAWLQRTAQPEWWTPLLKFFFIASYVVLAPLVGAVADAVPKARLMAWTNGIKLLGAAALGFGAHPLLAFAVVGFGAAAYAPAKYGLITERVGPALLVRANAWIEVTVVSAVLLGTASGGALVSDAFAGWAPAQGLDRWAAASGFGIGGGLSAALVLLIVLYAAANAVNLAIRDVFTVRVPLPRRPWRLVREFWAANRILWRDEGGGRLSLAVTSMFWGAGAVLQFAVLRWATDALGLSLSAAAYLQAAVAIGVVAGAAYAGRHIALDRAPRLWSAGVVLGLLVAAGPAIGSAGPAALLLVGVGVVGGVLMVPMNALLQHRGFRLLSPGRSIAVQGFNENAGILLMLAGYAALVWAEVPVKPTMVAFGLGIAAAMALLGWRLWRRRRGPARRVPAHTV